MMQQRKHSPSSLAPVIVSFRNDRGKRMHGAFFDHYLIRQISEHDTLTTAHARANMAAFEAFIADNTLALGMQDALGQHIIPGHFSGNMDDAGLLFIPGYSRGHTDTLRTDHEKKLIATARLCGQPVLAICAGAWTLWESYGGNIRTTPGHLYSSMPYLLNNGTAGNNRQVHRVSFTVGSMLSGAAKWRKLGLPNLSVNSVHWQVVDEKTTPDIFETTAVSVPDSQIAPKNRQGFQLEPEAGTIEAFESRHGTPVLGIQWHPEAYFAKSITPQETPHLNLLRYMVKAGDAFKAKRRMLNEFQSVFQPSDKNVSCRFFQPVQTRGGEKEPAVTSVTAMLASLSM